MGKIHFFDDESRERFDRAHRVRLLGEAFGALLDGRAPSREAALFVGGGGLAWLEKGGDLARDYFKVIKPKSRKTASAIWREIRSHPDEGQGTCQVDNIAPSSLENGG